MERDGIYESDEQREYRERLEWMGAANDVIDRIETIVTTNDKHFVVTLDTLHNDTPISDSPRLDNILRKSADYRIHKLHKYIREKAGDDGDAIDLVSAQISSVMGETTPDANGEVQKLYFGIVSMTTSDGITSRLATLIVRDDMIRENYEIGVVSGRYVVDTRVVSPVENRFGSAVMEHAGREQLELLEKVLEPSTERDEVDRAMSRLEMFALSVTDTATTDTFINTLNERRQINISAQDFIKEMSATQSLGKDGLWTLLDWLYDRNS